MTSKELCNNLRLFWSTYMTKLQCATYIDHMYKVVPVCILMKGQATGSIPNKIFKKQSMGRALHSSRLCCGLKIMMTSEKEEEDSAMKEIELVRLRREVHRLKAENRRLTTILMENSQEKETKTVEPEVQTVEPEVETVEPEAQTCEPEVSRPSVGGLVMARWTPDKVYYEAKVLSVTKRGNKCILLNCKVHNGWLQEDISSEVFEATLI
ncbi:unnamed protein product [Mytilus edulis]|uniref:Uncharacterized protein n=1 Tax=Mytilus edulis TaxID=6550 RepID=A0A8S3USS4_MYTED|nr:unnamed protein product [Mytilus edulis]